MTTDSRPWTIEDCLCPKCGCMGTTSEASEFIPRCSPCLIGVCAPVRYADAVNADNAWSAELEKLFGKRAGDVRYTEEGKGRPGTALNRAYLHWKEVSARWRNVMERNRK